MELLVFLIVAGAAVGSALVVLFHRNPVIGALFLVTNLLCIAILYLMLQAEFLAAIQVIVYAGAIMVLIIFVIMLLNLRKEGVGVRAGPVQLGLAGLAAGAFLISVGRAAWSIPAWAEAVPASYGSAAYVGRYLFGEFFYPFELLSLILLAAMAGAVVLAKREL